MNRKDLPEANATCEICGHRYRICNKCMQLRYRGIEAWRQHCDSPECYFAYILINTNYDDITREQFEHVINTELPDGREYTRDVQKKIDGIEQYLKEKESKNESEEPEAVYPEYEDVK